MFFKFFSGPSYDLLKHNCNNFSQELAQFLCGANIPKYILDLPSEVLQSKLEPNLLKFLQRLEQSARPVADEETPNSFRNADNKENSPEYSQLNSQTEEARSGVSTKNNVDKMN